ncbi:MAG: hypothetical protein Q9184_007928 [Pyrenodesmia sp. 2 TL-2023]
MATTTSYIVFLSPPLSTPEQIQEIGNLSQLPKVRPVSGEEFDEGEQLGEENQDDQDEQLAQPTCCCMVDRSTKDAILKWACSNAISIRPIIPIIPTESADTTQALRAGYPVPYFLYGSLESPALVQDILVLDQLPTLQSATVKGYEVRDWDRGQAVVASTDAATVEGRVYMVPSEEAVELLADHYGFAFEAASCRITYRTGEDVDGNVFRYRGDRLGLEDLKSRID